MNELANVKIEVKVGATVTQPPQPVSSFWQKSAGLYGFRGSAAITPGSNTVITTATDANNNQSTLNASVNASGSAIGAITYDDAGNMLNDGLRQFSWDAASRLIKIVHAGGTGVTEFTYDGLGRRVRLTETGTTVSDKRFVWDGFSIAEERDGLSNVVQQFFLNGEREGGTTLLYRKDSLGSVRELTDTSGNVQTRYDYDFWGRQTKLTGGPEADFGYATLLYHRRSGLNLATFRAYAADLGRWISRDPIGETGGINIYEYVNSNPVNFVDPSGLKGEHDETGENGLIGWMKNRNCPCNVLCTALNGFKNASADLEALVKGGGYSNLGQLQTMLAAMGSVQVGKLGYFGGSTAGAAGSFSKDMQELFNFLENWAWFNNKPDNIAYHTTDKAATDQQNFATEWAQSENLRVSNLIDQLVKVAAACGCNCAAAGQGQRTPPPEGVDYRNPSTPPQ